jgi:hypothetical protein
METSSPASVARDFVARDRKTVKFLLQGDGFAGVGSVEVRAMARRSTEADSIAVPVDPARTTPDRFECSEIRPLYADLTQAIAALDRYVFLLERTRPALEERLHRARNALAVALDLGGRVELVYGERGC